MKSRNDLRIPIPTVGEEERRRILSLPLTPRVHQAVYAGMPFVDSLEVAPPRTGWRSKTGTARLLSWNVARCKNVERIGRCIASAGADFVLLTEMDVGMARSGQRHTPRDLAAFLGLGYVFGVEFLELGLGDQDERLQYAGAANLIGYHGAAILSPAEIDSCELVRIEHSGGWFDGSRGERRVGGRMAILAQVKVGGRPFVLCTIHLESESDPEERAREIRFVLDQIDRLYPDAPSVIGGDFNTFSAGHDELIDPATRARLIAADSGRFAHPVPYEPLFRVAEDRGFHWSSCNMANVPTQREDSTPSRRGVMKIDWFLCRGVSVSRPDVIPAVDSESGEALSDHEAIAITIDGMAATP